MSLVLAFDTSGPWVRAALVQDGVVLAACDTPMAKGQAEALMPALEAVLATVGRDWSALDLLGVGTGPGNFTGVRIGVAAARGLALGLGIPAIGVDRFDAAALDAGAVPVAVPALRGQAWLRDAAGVRQVDALPPGTITDDTAPVPLAIAIARLATTRSAMPQPRPAPVYMRPADAAPPSEQPPVLLEG